MTRPTGTVTFLFTDVEGSTRLLDELGAERYAQALAGHRRLLRETFARRGGVEVDTQGDAFFYAFERASDAVAAAREGQRALADGSVRVRMGLHTGEPLATDEGYVGLDVHRAARIAAAGHGGQVLLSAAARDLAGIDARDLGEHRLKDLSAPERIYQLGEAEFPPLKTLHATNLPVPSTAFVGRERELAEVGAMIARPEVRLLTLTGPGGCGKTRLALQAAAAAVEAYPEGAWWVPLADLLNAEELGETAARALGGGGSLEHAVGGRRLLLLLDNLEHVISAVGELAAVLAACPGLDLLVTSRERLRLAAEHVYAVPPLDRADARELFTARARATRPDFVPDDSLDDLCARLDDLPLALELAAARTSVLSTAELLARLGRRLDLLRGGRDADRRQQTLRATIAWSYDLLDDGEQTLLARLAVFRGGCTLDAAERVAGADLDLLESLVDKSLVRSTRGRFWLLATIGDFAAERLEESGEAEELRRRHAEFVLELADRAGLGGGFAGAELRPEALEPVRADLDNVRAALDWSLDHDPVLGLRLAVSLESFWVVAVPLEATRRLGALLERAGDAPSELRARGCRALGGAANPAGDDALAEHAYREALDAFRALGDDEGATGMLARLGYAALYGGDLRGAGSLGEEALDGFRRLEHGPGAPLALGLLGEVALARGEAARGLELMRESAELAGREGFGWWRAGMLGKPADALLDGGLAGEAEGCAAEALDLSHELGDRLRCVRGLARLAVVAAARGHHERAGRLWGAVEAEEARGPVGAWESERARFERRALVRRGDEFEQALAAGRRLSLDEAVEEGLRGLD